MLFLAGVTACSGPSAPPGANPDPVATSGGNGGTAAGGAGGGSAGAAGSGGTTAGGTGGGTGGAGGVTGPSGAAGAITPGGGGAGAVAGTAPDSDDAGAGLLPETNGSVPAGVDPGVKDTFTCNLVLGIKQTGEWFSAGFEAVVDNARWEVVPIHDGHIELWADPKNGIWSQKLLSPCAQGAAQPDRVIYVGTNYDYVTVDEWLPKFTAVVDNIKAKYSGVKRIELMTHVRAPKNVACPGALDFKTTIKPGQDQALAMAAAKYPGLVFVAPKFEVRSCADYGLYPHFKGDGAAAVAKAIGDFYGAP